MLVNTGTSNLKSISLIPVNSTDLSSTLLISDPKIAVYWLSTWFEVIYWLATDFADFKKPSIFSQQVGQSAPFYPVCLTWPN